MSRRARKKAAWFARGAEAVARATEGEHRCYVCPLCAKPVPDIEDLTFEHAPPGKLGGREVALTCRPCNSGSGYRLDVAMRRAEDLLDWGAGTSSRWIRARLSVPGAPAVNIQAERSVGGGFNLIGMPRRNDPAVTAAFQAALDAMVDGPVHEQSLELSFPASLSEYRIAGADVRAGWLRAAYLLAFAKLGYRYALRALMTPVRDQIADPAGAHIDRFYLAGRHEPPDRQRMIVVAAPRSLRSVSVLMGRHLVFLPGIHGDSDRLYERLADRAYWPPRRLSALTGPVIAWPHMPELALDFA